MNSFLDVAVETAREAGAILLAEFARPVKISYKGEVDIVTQADKRSEQAIVSAFAEPFPETRDCGRGGRGHGKRFSLPLARGSARRHHQFCSRLSVFRRFLGLEEAGELIAGVIYQPVSGELFTAAKGEGHI